MSTEKPDFEKAQNLATELLLKQSCNSLMIDVCHLKFDKKIIIDTMQSYCNVTNSCLSDYTCDGYSGSYVLKLNNGTHIILYDDDNDYFERKHWGIAHEIGHIYLGHKTDGKKEEIEAHFFAAQLLMPEVVIRYALKCKGKFTSNDIYDNFNVSYESASKRVHTLNNKPIKYNNNDRLLLYKYKSIIEEKFLIQKSSCTTQKIICS